MLAPVLLSSGAGLTEMERTDFDELLGEFSYAIFLVGRKDWM